MYRFREVFKTVKATAYLISPMNIYRALKILLFKNLTMENCSFIERKTPITKYKKKN